VNERGVPFAFGRRQLEKPADAERVVLFHYQIKSREDYLEKIERGGGGTGGRTYLAKNFESMNRYGVG